jgi:hypothetical protein
LRIDQKKGAPAMLQVGSTQLDVETPLKILVKQYADGRHVGGVTVEKRHPKYVQPELEPVYGLWLRIIDGVARKPLPEAIVELWRWDDAIRTPYGVGAFVMDGQHYTNGNGVIQLDGLRANHLHWYTVRMPGWRIASRCLRPLPNQMVRLHMRAWKMTLDMFRYTWQDHDVLDDIAGLTNLEPHDILKMNNLVSSSQLSTGMTISLPCYQGTYRPENWETLDAIARRFGLKDSQVLADVNGLHDIKAYDGAADLKLPHWRFFHARNDDSLGWFDEHFGLPSNSTVPVHRVYRPRGDALLPGEVVAVPTRRRSWR